MQEELIETITHLAFYSGWPNAMTAITVPKEIFEKNDLRRAYHGRNHAKAGTCKE
jgi:hypothetical protein